MTNNGAASSPRGSRGVEIALQVLDLLAGWTDPATLARPSPLSLHAMASALAIPEPTAHRIVAGLVSGGWVEKVGGQFRLAFKVGLIGVGIHEGLRRQRETCDAMLRTLDRVGTDRDTGR
jgi:DNA-binding IclR family transcriptional regulator